MNIYTKTVMLFSLSTDKHMWRSHATPQCECSIDSDIADYPNVKNLFSGQLGTQLKDRGYQTMQAVKHLEIGWSTTQ